MMNRRTFSAALVAGAAASPISTKRTTAASTAPVKARNVVLVHGLVCRRIMLVGGDRAIAGRGAQCHGRPKPVDDTA